MKPCLSLACMSLISVVLSACAGDEAKAPALDLWEDVKVGAAADDATSSPEVNVSDSGAADAGTVMPSFPAAPERLGGARPARYVLPGDYDPAEPWPLVMLLHGYGANFGDAELSAGDIQDAYLGLSARATELGFLMLIPDGQSDPQGNRYWNATDYCCDFYGSGVDDEAYLLALLDEMASYFHVDAKRIYLIGHSNGAFMSHRLACVASERFAAVASLAGTTDWDPERCPSDASPMSLLHIHGTADPTIRYDGSTGDYPGVSELLARWTHRNGCEAEPEQVGVLDLVSGDAGEEAQVSRWARCQGDVVVEAWDLLGVGHIPTFRPEFSAQALAFLLAQRRPD